jgi:hypothetical protein
MEPRRTVTNRFEPHCDTKCDTGRGSILRVPGIELWDVGNGTDRKNQEPPKRPLRTKKFEAFLGEFAVDKCNCNITPTDK